MYDQSQLIRDLLRSFPGGTSGKEPTCQCRRHKRHQFNPWVGKIPWKRAPPPTPVLLPGKFHGLRSLAGYSPWGCKELDMTVQLHFLMLETIAMKKNKAKLREWGKGSRGAAT